MIFRIDVSPVGIDRAGESVRQQIAEVGAGDVGSINTSRVYLIDVDAPRAEVERIAFDLLADPIVERAQLVDAIDQTNSRIEVHLKPGVMDPVAASTEMALRDAGIAHLNLVRVSSIFPPKCRIIKREDGQKELLPGQIQFVVLSESATNEPRFLNSAAGRALVLIC